MKLVKYLLLVFVISSLFNCSKIEDEEDTEAVVGDRNPNPAKNNSEIVSEYKLGENGTFQSFYCSEKLEDGTFITLGGNGSLNDLQNIDKSGNVIRSIALNFRAVNILKSGNRLIVIGGKDTDNQNSSGYDTENGIVQIYDNNLNLVDELIFSEPNYKLQLRDIKFIKTIDGVKEIYCIAGLVIDINGIQYPYISNINIYDDKIYKVLNSKVLNEFPKNRILSMELKYREFNDGEGFGTNITTQVFLFAVANEYSDKVSNIANIHLINESYSIDDNSLIANYFSTNYDKVILGESNLNCSTVRNCVKYDMSSNSLIIGGETKSNKQPPASNGGYWSSGYVLSINPETGNVKWKTVINLSNKDEKIYGLKLINENIYCVGIHSNLIYTSNNKEYGNGLLSILDLYTGNIKTSKTFGLNTKKSLIYDIENDQNYVYLFGYADASATSSKKWFFKTAL